MYSVAATLAAHPTPHGLRELRAVVIVDALRHASGDEQVRESLLYVVGSEVRRHIDGQAFSPELVGHRQHPERPAVARPPLHEVVAPDAVFMPEA